MNSCPTSLRAVTMTLMMLALSGCGGSNPLQPYSILFSELTSGSEPTLSLDPAEITSARIEGDRLYVDVTFGGGCAEHIFSLVRPTEVWRESDPVQTDLRLTHDAKGDRCLALLNQPLSFDLSPLKAAFYSSYPGTSGVIDISLHEPTGATSPLRMRYEF
jgi:hypothetical protein